MILAAVLGFGLLAAAACAGYWYGTESANLKSQSAKPRPKTQIQETLTPSVEDPTKDWQVFRSDDCGFELRYPTGWDALLSENINSLYIGPKDRFDQMSTKPGVYAAGFIPIVINFNQPIEGLKIVPDRAKIINQENIEIAGISATGSLLEITEPAAGFNIGDQYTRTIVKNTNTYMEILLFDDQYKTVFNQILSTFKFLD